MQCVCGASLPPPLAGASVLTSTSIYFLKTKVFKERVRPLCRMQRAKNYSVRHAAPLARRTGERPAWAGRAPTRAPPSDIFFEKTAAIFRGAAE